MDNQKGFVDSFIQTGNFVLIQSSEKFVTSIQTNVISIKSIREDSCDVKKKQLQKTSIWCNVMDDIAFKKKQMHSGW